MKNLNSLRVIIYNTYASYYICIGIISTKKGKMNDNYYCYCYNNNYVIKRSKVVHPFICIHKFLSNFNVID